MTRAQQQLFQDLLPGLAGLEEAIATMREAGSEERGAVFTRKEVVEFIFDLAGYVTGVDLTRCRLLEPSFGSGNFLLPAVNRLLDSFFSRGGSIGDISELRDSIRAVELHGASFSKTAIAVRRLLINRGVAQKDAEDLTETWLSNEDFLLAELPGEFSHIIGNPPYVRQEKIPDVLLTEYRSRYSTIFDRADLYVPFIERSLRLLSPNGSCVFICSDRWMKNRYGAPLRKLVSEGFRLKAFIDMTGTSAFESDVIAYPAIAAITRETPGPVLVAARPEIGNKNTHPLIQAIRNPDSEAENVLKVDGVVRGDAPWLFENAAKLALVRRLENDFPTLEGAGCRVGIGVATGADKVFIGRHETLDIEPDRKLPLVMTRDIMDGEVNWQGLSLVNPFNDSGHLVNLRDYPKLAAYFERNRKTVGNRHVARKNPSGWYRTIDKVSPPLARQPKLLIPDIKGKASVVYEEGRFYPHHNLYFIVAEHWDLRALQTVLSAGIAHLFVSIYSTRMRGGYLRFQAQYLRRIRIPAWETLSVQTRSRLIRAREMSKAEIRNLIAGAYHLSEEEAAVLEEAHEECL